MKKCVVRFSFFIIPLILFYTSVGEFSHFILNVEMEEKGGTFLSGLPDDGIIVGGDSRAERQVIPDIIAKTLGRRCVNIAIGSGDLITTYNTLDKYNSLNQKRLIIISTSIFQINDSSVEPGYISHAAILNANLLEQIGLLKKEFIFTYQKLLELLFSEMLRGDKILVLKDGDRRIRSGGYYMVNDHRVPKRSVDLESVKRRHPWYGNMNLRGIRYKVLKKAIKKFGESEAKIVIYQPPVSPIWLENTRGTFVDKGERLFGRILKNECARYKNIVFIDFYKWKPEGLQDSDFYDTHHLKLKGAKKFTHYLIKEVRKYDVI